MSKKLFIYFLYVFILLQIPLFAETINIDQTVIDANKANKNTLIYLHKTGCPYCERLEEFTLDDEDVDNYIKENYRFVVLNVSIDDDIVIYQGDKISAKEFAAFTGYNFYPSVLFLDKDGEVEHGSVGYIEEQDFLVILKYIRTDTFKTMSIEQYKQKLGIEEEKNKVLIDKRQKL